MRLRSTVQLHAGMSALEIAYYLVQANFKQSKSRTLAGVANHVESVRMHMNCCILMQMRWN